VENIVEGLFPTPVYFSDLGRDVTKKELQEVKKHSLDVYRNAGNITSNNVYILDLPVFKKLKDELSKHLEEYVKQVIAPKEDISLYITQSWLNYTDEHQFHHEHAHPNSLISGVFYFDADEDLDRIKFFDSRHTWFEFESDSWSSFNSKTWWFPVKTGKIVLFPSDLRHSVEFKEGKNTRTSLAFNTFVKGTLGREKRLTELKL